MLCFCYPRLANQLRDLHQQGQGNVQNLPVINSEDIRKAKGVLRNLGRGNPQPEPQVYLGRTNFDIPHAAIAIEDNKQKSEGKIKETSPLPDVNMSVEPRDGRTGGLFSIQPNMPALIPASRPKCSSATATQREEKLPR